MMRIRITLLAVFAVLAAPASAARPLQTAISYDGLSLYSPLNERSVAMARIHAAGATIFRSTIYWYNVDTDQPKRPADPNDPAYHWQAYDREMRLIVKHHMTPVVAVYGAPVWARTGDKQYASAPDPAAWRAFVTAAAERYSGRTRGLPRVRYWQAWLEPNLNSKLAPQVSNGKFVSPDIYRRLVNIFASAVKSVHRDNVVIAGGTSPFSDFDATVKAVDPRWGPLTFMRAVLCLDRSLHPTCNAKIRFDIWAHHPYTSGGPGHRARNRGDDASLGDMPLVRKTLDAAVRAGHVMSRGQPRLWVTEFSWDSNPPDLQAVPMRLLERWVPQALYEMWSDGVSMVTWLTLRDNPPNDFVQSGLWFSGRSIFEDRPKPILESFRFPFVAFRAGGKNIKVWGRTPWGRRGEVVVQQTFHGGWKTLGTLTSDGGGIFQSRFSSSPNGLVRARLVRGGETSVPFSLKPVPDRFVQPFGTFYCGEPPCRNK